MIMISDALLEHYEQHLGHVKSHFGGREAGQGFRILGFKDTPFHGCETVVTYGLAKHVLQGAVGPAVRQELVMCGFPDDIMHLAGAMSAVGERLAETQTPLKHGEILGPWGALAPESPMEAVLCASPWYWKDDAFGRCKGQQPDVLMVWLVPISAAEAAWCQQEGIEEFEALINAADPELLDLHRESLVED